MLLKFNYGKSNGYPSKLASTNLSKPAIEFRINGAGKKLAKKNELEIHDCMGLESLPLSCE